MKISRIPLFDKKQTAIRLYYLIEKYYPDLKQFKVKKNGSIVPITELTIREFFNFVKNIPYRQDVKPVEIISRPTHIIKNRFIGMDCKKKAVLIGSYLKSKGIPYRLMSISRKKSGRIHHVFPQAFIKNRWQNVDATYRKYRPFQKKRVTNAELL